MLQEWRPLNPLNPMANPAQPGPRATGMDTGTGTGLVMGTAV